MKSRPVSVDTMAAIIPSVLVKTYEEFKARVHSVEHLVDLVQVDIGDGRFVANETFRDPALIKNYPWECDFELHLMMERPEETLAAWIDTGARRIIVHYEATEKLAWIAVELKRRGVEVGLAVKLETPLIKVLPYLPQIDTALLMAVEPGANGAPFNPVALERIRFLRAKWPSGTIAVDGGLHPDTLSLVALAGANFFVVGSELSRAGDAALAGKLAALEALVSPAL